MSTEVIAIGLGFSLIGTIALSICLGVYSARLFAAARKMRNERILEGKAKG
jgi:hypothetical protein